jgi:hypothetical protein
MRIYTGQKVTKKLLGTCSFLFLVFLFLIITNCSHDGSSHAESTSQGEEINTDLPAPTELSAVANGQNQVILSWNDNSENEDGFRVERKVKGGSYSRIATVAANVSSYSDNGLSFGITYYYRVRAYNAQGGSYYSDEVHITTQATRSGAIIIDHTCTELNTIPTEWINAAKSSLHIVYGHTSHGSQLVTGMEGLVTWKGSLYAFNSGGSDGALDLTDSMDGTPFSGGASDLGGNWEPATREYLNAHPNAVNVIIWSWCGQVNDSSAADITNYLNLMNSLENDYPNVLFVYMTGHLEGTGLQGNLHLRNEQIRAYCRANNKILYDFADIESYNPDGEYFGDRYANDNCNYDANNDGDTEDSDDGNWAREWQASHTVNVDWYVCGNVYTDGMLHPAHTWPLNGNLKAYAAWWLWARLAGWNGQ